MDVVCVQQQDGSFKSSPFHVRFGKLKLLKSARKSVAITVNGVESEVSLMLGQEGQAFFLREAMDDEILANEPIDLDPKELNEGDGNLADEEAKQEDL